MTDHFIIPIDAITKSILSILLKSKGPLSAAQIAEELAITPRMVSYRLKRARYWLNEQETELVIKQNYGIIIKLNKYTREELEQKLECSSAGKVIWSPESRWKVLVFRLLTKDNPGPAVIKQLQSKIGVSRPTLLTDLNKVEKWLNDYNLVLVRRPGYGIEIEGEERSLREAIVCLVLDNINNSYLQAYLASSSYLPITDFNPLFEDCIDAKNYVKDLNLNTISRQVHNLEGRLGIHFTDTASNYLSLLLAITIQRSRKGYFINHFQVENNIKDTIVYIEAKRLYSLIEKEFDLIFPLSEIYYFAINLAGSKTTNPQTSLSDLPIDTFTLWDPSDVINDFLLQVSLYLHPTFRVDRQIKRNLTLHIKPTLVRLRYDLPIRNPLLENIKLKYPYLFKITRECSGVIEVKIHRRVPDEELGYLVMHLAAELEKLEFRKKSRLSVLLVCGAGKAIVWLMASKLSRLFPDVIIKDILSAAEIPRKAAYFNDVDFVISTVPLKNIRVPVISVSPLLESSDLLKLRAKLRDNFQNCSSPVAYGTNGPTLVDLITADNIRVNIHVENWSEVVEEAGKPLLMSGAIKREYILAMKEAIRLYGPYVVIAPGVVLLHAQPEQGAKRVCMSLITLKKPICFGHPRFDPVEVAFVLGTTNDLKYINALRQLTSLVREKKKMRNICNAGSRNEVLQILHEHVVNLEHVHQTRNTVNL
jgi:transcriptional antiterminator